MNSYFLMYEFICCGAMCEVPPLFGEGVNVLHRPRPLRLLRSRLDFLPVGGVAVPPPTIRVRSSCFSPPSSSCSCRPPCSPACLRPRRSASFPTSCSHRSNSSAPFRRCRKDVPSSSIGSRRHQRQCQPRHPTRARRGSGVHSAGDGHRLDLRLHRRPPLLIVESLPLSSGGE